MRQRHWTRRHTVLLIAGGALVATLYLTSGSGQPDVPAAAVSAAAMPYVSGGLGLSYGEWERLHGTATPDRRSRYSEDRAWAVELRDANVARIWRYWKQAPLSLDQARRLSKTLIPADSEVFRMYQPSANRFADLYSSQSLVARYQVVKAGRAKVTAWGDYPAGSFAVLYEMEGDSVKSMLIGLGFSPVSEPQT
jgi:hypothetical protein